MRHLIPFASLAAMLLVAGAAGADGLSQQRGGLGLKAQAPVESAFGAEAAQTWLARSGSDYQLYGNGGERPLTGLRAAEAYAGIVYTLSGNWGSSLEGGFVPESALLPRRYALTGQVHTALSEGRTLSMGLKYRVYDADAAMRAGPAGESTSGTGYTLAPYRVPGASIAPSYQLQFSYQFSAASTVGMAVGRDVESFTPYFDLPGSGPRQVTVTGQHWLTPSWALSYDVLSQDAMTPLRSLGLRLGVRYNF